MEPSRRVSLYLVALAGALLFLASLAVGAWRWGASDLASVLVPWVILALAGAVMWAVGWFSANRQARPLTMAGAAERASEPRKAYLALAQLAALLVAASLAWRALKQVVLQLLGSGDAAGWPGGVLAPAAAAFLALALWGYHEFEAVRDEDIGTERGGAARWRRGYVYAVILAGSALTLVGAGELLRASIQLAIRPLSGDTAWHDPAAGAVAALLIGVVLGTLGWGRANRAMAKAPAVEANAPSRVLLRHAGVLLGSLLTLISLGYLIEQMLLRGVTRGSVELGQRALFGMFDWTWALAYLPVATIVWLSASRGVRTDAETGGEVRRTGTVRRAVRYAVAALALAGFWYGLVEFARLILQVMLGAGGSGDAAGGWLQRFATTAAFLVVGAPAWWGFWWSQQVRARTAGAHGRAERASAIRRAYLVLIVLVGGVLVVAAAGFGTFLALNWQAAGELGGVRAAVAGAGAAALVSLFWAVTHGLTLRSDLNWLAREPVPAVARPSPAAREAPPAVAALRQAATAAPAPAPDAARAGAHTFSREELAALAAGQTGAGHPADARPAVAILDGRDGGTGVALIRALREEVPGVRVWPVGLNPAAEAAMIAELGAEAPEELPANLLERVAAILLPSDALTGGELAAGEAAELSQAVSASSARVVLLPPRNPRFRWVAAPDWPRERWVQEAVVEVADLVAEASAR